MITNERQYRITKAALTKFENSLQQLQNEAAPDAPARLQKAYVDAAQSEIEILRGQLHEYDALRGGRIEVWPELAALENVPRTLIRARIASGMTQEQLARALGLKTQQVQRYEASNYAGASLKRVREIAQLLAGAQPLKTT